MVILSVLQTVVADNVDGELLQLIEDPHDLSGTGHHQMVLLRQCFQRGTVFGSQRLLVLGQCAIEIHSNDLDLGNIQSIHTRLPNPFNRSIVSAG